MTKNSNYKYKLIATSKFKKDIKLAKKRGLDISTLENIVIKLAKDEPLEDYRNDHNLKGNWKDFRECHIDPDWLLIYQKNNTSLILTLARIGSHSDLF